MQCYCVQEQRNPTKGLVLARCGTLSVSLRCFLKATRWNIYWSNEGGILNLFLLACIQTYVLLIQDQKTYHSRWCSYLNVQMIHFQVENVGLNVVQSWCHCGFSRDSSVTAMVHKLGGKVNPWIQSPQTVGLSGKRSYVKFSRWINFSFESILGLVLFF